MDPEVYGEPRQFFGAVLVIAVAVFAGAMLWTDTSWHGPQLALGAVLLAVIVGHGGWRWVVCVKLADDQVELITPFATYTVPWSEVERVQCIFRSTSIKLHGCRPSFYLANNFFGGRECRELTDILYEKTNTPRL